ncbi:MAG: hypothetical protein ACREBG_23320 [Pyrinomonadaceae bacterium]
MNRLVIKTILHWLEISLYLLVPLAASIIALSLTVFHVSQEVALQMILGIVAGLAISESLGRFGTLNDIAVQTKQLSRLSNMELLRSADEAGVVSLSLRSNPARISDITNEIQRARGTLDLCGVALPGLIENELIRKAVLEHSQKSDVRVLLLKPDSEEAKRRADIEMPLGRRTITDIETTIEWLRNHQLKNKRFRVHLYSLPPMLSLIITDNFAFVEPYHFGRPDGLEGCIGGHVPMMKIRNRRELGSQNPYEFFKAHFEYLWRFTQGLRVHLPIAVESVKPSTFVVLENQMEYDIPMAGWKFSAQGSVSPYLFKSDFVWRKKTTLALYCGTEQPGGVEVALPAEEGFMGNNSILTLTNAVGTVMAELAPQSARQMVAHGS